MKRPDPTERFSSRVLNYIGYRPPYPAGMLDPLVAECGLGPASVVADVGAGTGMLTECFAELGSEVYAIEPNREMREAGVRLLAHHPRVHFLEGRAERTSLPEAWVDFVAAGQAFHWFDPAQAQAEFRRILRPGGWVAVVWNLPDGRSAPCVAAYERLLERFGTDYADVAARHANEAVLTSFFDSDGFRRVRFPNSQDFDFDGLKGRLLSSSFVPGPDDPACEPMLEALARIFNDYQRDGRVVFPYTATLYLGHPGGGQSILHYV